MTEIEKIFYNDVREKKVISRSASHRASRGKRAITVHNPSDHLTAKELKNMSGECKEFNLKKPMNWKELNGMPKDLQAEYLNWLTEEFNMPRPLLAEYMGTTKSCIDSKYYKLKKLGFNMKVKNGSVFNEDRVMLFFADGKLEENYAEVKQQQQAVPCEQEESECSWLQGTKDSNRALKTMEVDFSFVFTPAAMSILTEDLNKFIDAGSKVQMKIQIEVE